MKRNKLKIITKILAIITICLISFVGIYVQKLNKMKNIVKDYSLTKDLEGYRQVIFEISSETDDEEDSEDTDSTEEDSEDTDGTEENSQENLTVENYEKSKSVIEKRLEAFGVEDYNLSLDKKTGTMYLQLPEDSTTDRVISNITETGDLELKDSEDGTVYLTNDQVKTASALYNTTTSGTTVYLQIVFNKEGTSILKDLSTNQYATLSDEEETDSESDEEETDEEETEETDLESSEEENTSEETTEESSEDDSEESEEEATQKEITLSICGNDMITTSFDDPVENGTLNLTMNSASTDSDSITDTLRTTSTIVLLLENGQLPLTYTVTENQYVSTDITNTVMRNVIIVAIVVLAILLIIMIAKNKVRGLLAAISYIGFVALYLLLVRYTNVSISISGAIAILVVFLINYALNMKLLTISAENGKEYAKEYVKSIAKIIPILTISVIFTFMSWTALSSFGMLLFWGLILTAIYNIIIAKNVID